MELTMSDINRQLDQRDAQAKILVEAAEKHLADWVRRQVAACQLDDGTITRESVRRNCEVMDRATFMTLRAALGTNTDGMAFMATGLLRQYANVSDLLRVKECLMVPGGTLMFVYQH